MYEKQNQFGERSATCCFRISLSRMVVMTKKEIIIFSAVLLLLVASAFFFRPQFECKTNDLITVKCDLLNCHSEDNDGSGGINIPIWQLSDWCRQ